MALARDLPEEALFRGDVVVVVDRLPGTEASGGEAGYLIEVSNALGQTLKVLAVPASALAPLTAGEVLSVRPYSPAGAA